MPSAIAKSLSRLSREKLVDLCISWSKSSKYDPYLSSNRNTFEAEDEDYLHEPARSRYDLKSVYESFKQGDSNLAQLSKRDIVDRIVDGDWRRGLSYEQLASIDFANLEENDTALRWSALKLVPLSSESESQGAQRQSKKRKLTHVAEKKPHYPETTAAIFVQNLKQHISPLVKAHYHIHRLAALKLSVVRLYITPNKPFAPVSTNVPRQSKATTEMGRILYIALPDSCPYVYVSISGATGSKAHAKTTSTKPTHKIDIATIKRVVLEAIPKALSRPQQRWSLETTRLTAKSLRAMVLLRGGGQIGTAGGSLSQVVQSQLPGDQCPNDTAEDNDGNIEHAQQVEGRFGCLTGASHAKLDRVQVTVRSLLAASGQKSKKRKRIEEHAHQEDPSPITITLSGADIFAGLKQLALLYPQYVDVNRLPSTFTGEQAMSTVKL